MNAESIIFDFGENPPILKNFERGFEKLKNLQNLRGLICAKRLILLRLSLKNVLHENASFRKKTSQFWLFQDDFLEKSSSDLPKKGGSFGCF